MFRSSLKLRRARIQTLCSGTQTSFIGGFRRLISTESAAEDVNYNHFYDKSIENLKNAKRDGAPRNSDKTIDLGHLSKFTSAVDAQLPRSSPEPSTWSSPYDAVYRQPYSKDTMHLLSLLDACLSSKNYERAVNILNALYPIALKDQIESKNFIHSINKYLYELSHDDSIDLAKVEFFVDKLPYDYPTIEANDKTYAIVLAKILKKNGNLSEIKPYLRKWTFNGRFKVADIMRNIDVLGFDSFKTLLLNEIIGEDDIPREFKALANELREAEKQPEEVPVLDMSANSDFFNSKSLPPTLQKDEDDLLTVDTFGMKAIRHTLLGLGDESGKLGKHFVDKLELQSAEFETLMNDKKGLEDDNENPNIDFFEIYKTLPKADKAKFDEALSEYNVERQRQLELRSLNAAREKWKHDFEDAQKRGDISMNNKLNVRLWKWYTDMLPFVEAEVARCTKIIKDGLVYTKEMSSEERRQERDRLEYAPFFSLVDSKKMTVITILELLKLNSTGGVHEGMRTVTGVLAVGKAVEMEYRSEQLLKSENKTFFQQKDLKMLKKNTPELKRALMNTRTNFRNSQMEEHKVSWPHDMGVKIGSTLVSLLMHVAKVEVSGIDPTNGNKVYGEQPAFYHGYQYSNGNKLGILKIHRNLLRQLSGDNLLSAVQPQSLPMLVKPRPWTTYNNGGFMYSQNLLVRIKESPENMAYLKASSDQLDQVYDGLNVLGETAWTVNKKVYQTIAKVWNTGEKFLKIPGHIQELVLPEKPPANADPSIKTRWQIDCKKASTDFSNDRSERCDHNYKMEIARAFIGEKIYFPHNVDFRGRAYPLPPHFNHLGNDVVRSLLVFWEGRELGVDGLRWLKVHLANLCGFDKATFEDRVKYVEDHLEDIRDSARDPLGGQGWWKKADKPWQALACCIEVAEAYKLEDPTKFVSHQPVHQDGTCNGLQHYAALGGDIEGATQVNLAPSDSPQDVYKYVAGLVQQRVDRDAEQGNDLALKVQHHITRKVVKQTVMTNVYGVTFVGAAEQIQRQLNDIFGSSDEQVYASARYLTRHVFDSVRELFHGAHLIQDWLGECAKRISKSIRLDVDEKKLINGSKPEFMASVIWTTPLGLPCVQPYRDDFKKQVYTNLQTIFLSDPFKATPVNSRRQASAFPPNYIHSLDASHMLMAAKKCGEAGIEFAAVHDSYWTHAADVPKMNEIIRNEFIRLHEVDLIAAVKSEFDRRYKGFVQVVTIEKSAEIIDKVTVFKKKVSKDLGRSVTLADEIYLEKRRQQLLDSEDPADVELGKKMVTTVSLIENDDWERLVVKARQGADTATVKTYSLLVPLKLPEIPPKGDFDVSVIKGSRYFFS